MACVAEPACQTIASCSGRDQESSAAGPWWAALGARLAGTTFHLRVGCNTPAGQFWISIPLRRGRQSPASGRIEAANASFGLSRLPSWQSRLLQRLLADPEVQAQLKKATLTLQEDTIARWVKAKGSSHGIAEEALRAHLAWRAENVPGGQIHEEAIPDALADEKAFLQGCDNSGRAVIIVLGQRHFTNSRDLAETIRFISYVLDNAIAATDPVKNPAGQLLCLLDLDGVRPRNVDVPALRAIFDLVQNHYPEHLAMMWFLNAPLIFRMAWKGISPFIQPSTKEKIEFLSGDHCKSVLQSYISPEVLPAAYGGQAAMVPVEAAVAQQRQRSHTLAARTRPLTEGAPMFAKGRATAAGRAIKRWAGASWGFVKRHTPTKSWFTSHAKGAAAQRQPGRIRTSFSNVGRALSTRLSATPRSLASPRAGGLLRSLSKLTPAAVAKLMVAALRTLSQNAAQALHWAWDHMTGRQYSRDAHHPANSHLLRLHGLHALPESPHRHVGPADAKHFPCSSSQPTLLSDRDSMLDKVSTGANRTRGARRRRQRDCFCKQEGELGADDGLAAMNISTEVRQRAAALHPSQLLKCSFSIAAD